MVCAHCGRDHRARDCPNFCKLCQVVGHRQKTANCQFHVCSKCNTVGHSARACKAPQLQQRMVRGEREPEKDHIQSDAPMATGGDKHADDDDDECDQRNRTNDHEPDDNMSNNDDDADRDVNDHSDKDDDDYCKLDCDELDTLETTADLAPCQCTPHSCTLRANHSSTKSRFR